MKNPLASLSLTSVALIGTLLVGVLLLSGCNTVDGAGRDIERAGEEIQDAAN